MSNAGRPRKTEALKKLTGTQRADRVLEGVFEPPQMFKLPPPPKILREAGRKTWKQTGEILVEKGVLTEVDLSSFERYCLLIDIYKDMEADFAGSADMPPADYYKIVTHLKMIHTFEAQYGLNPAARAKINIPSPVKKESRLMQLVNSKKNVR